SAAPGVRVLDFGISKHAAPGEQGLTETGFALGTPAYMSPEQGTDSATVSAATDVYSLGIVLFQLISGRLPFVATDTAAMLMSQRSLPGLGSRRVALAAIGGVVVMLFVVVADRIELIRRRPLLVVFPMSGGLATVVGVMAAYSGGFSSPALVLIVYEWATATMI